MKILIVDTETGGLNPEINPLLELGAVVWEDREIIDEFQVFVNELDILYKGKLPVVEQAALDINKIDLDWIRENGLRPREALIEYHKFFGKHFHVTGYASKINLGGHNTVFDTSFKKRLYWHTKTNYEELFSHRLLDTSGIIQFLILTENILMKKSDLTSALKYFDIDVVDRHTGLGDARATAQLLNELIKLVEWERQD